MLHLLYMVIFAFPDSAEKLINFSSRKHKTTVFSLLIIDDVINLNKALLKPKTELSSRSN